MWEAGRHNRIGWGVRTQRARTRVALLVGDKESTGAYCRFVDDETSRLPSACVWPAQGIVSVQAACALHEALTLMKERARTDGCTLDAIRFD